MKITDKEIAKYYGVTTRTITNYKNGDTEKQALYNAMRHFLESPPEKEEFPHMSIKELHYAHEKITTKIQEDTSSLQIIADFIQQKNTN